MSVTAKVGVPVAKEMLSPANSAESISISDAGAIRSKLNSEGVSNKFAAEVVKLAAAKKVKVTTWALFRMLGMLCSLHYFCKLDISNMQHTPI